MGIVTREELAFDLDKLKALQDQRRATITRLEEAISAEETAYAERAGIIEVLENEPEQTDAIQHDLPVLIGEQMKRLGNIQTIKNTIKEEEQALMHEQEIIKAIEEKS